MQKQTLIKAVKADARFKQLSVLQKASVIALALTVASPSFAAGVTMPAVDVTDILTYIGLLIAAVSTVGAAVLMIYLAAKGIKAIRSAF